MQVNSTNNQALLTIFSLKNIPYNKMFRNSEIRVTCTHFSVSSCVSDDLARDKCNADMIGMYIHSGYVVAHLCVCCVCGCVCSFVCACVQWQVVAQCVAACAHVEVNAGCHSSGAIHLAFRDNLSLAWSVPSGSKSGWLVKEAQEPTPPALGSQAYTTCPTVHTGSGD